MSDALDLIDLTSDETIAALDEWHWDSHLIKMVDFKMDQGTICFVTEHADKGNLKDFLKSIRNEGISERMTELEKSSLLKKNVDTHRQNMAEGGERKLRKQMLCIFQKVCKAIQHMHHQGLVHGSLDYRKIFFQSRQ